jgi:hypothetical protein
MLEGFRKEGFPVSMHAISVHVCDQRPFSSLKASMESAQAEAMVRDADGGVDSVIFSASDFPR